MTDPPSHSRDDGLYAEPAILARLPAVATAFHKITCNNINEMARAFRLEHGMNATTTAFYNRFPVAHGYSQSVTTFPNDLQVARHLV